MMSYLECLCKNLCPNPKPKNGSNTLVLGFYDRGNTGDELYREAFARIFKTARMRFACMDDVDVIPADVETIICGGGDVINAYFMDKFERVLRRSPPASRRTIYAVSVGVQYADDARRLAVFDHVFVRNSFDYHLAVRAVGARNVSLVNDAVSIIPAGYYGQPPSLQHGVTHVGVFPATPVCIVTPQVVRKLAKALLAALPDDAVVHIVPFNLFDKNPSECDVPTCEQLEKLLFARCVVRHEPGSARACASLAAAMDVNVCMRFHAAVISCLSVGPAKTVLLSSEPKMQKFAADRGCTIVSPTLTTLQGLTTIINRVVLAKPSPSSAASSTSSAASAVAIPTSYPTVDSVVFFERKLGQFLVARHRTVPSDYDAVVERVFEVLAEKGVDEATALSVVYDRGGACRGGHLDAGLVCHLISGDVSSPHAYGLAENMVRSDFVLDDGMRCIWHEVVEASTSERVEKRRQSSSRLCLNETDPSYYPNFARELIALKGSADVSIDFDRVLIDAMKDYHRSGWPYAVSGLMPLHHEVHRRRGPSVYVDLYVDRTFHWGLSAYSDLKMVPYRRPWIGVVHHTFNEDVSRHNSAELFRKKAFQDSLASCVCIVSLTKYMGVQLRQALDRIGHRSVPVHVVYHPTETPTSLFRMSAFMSNPARKAVQIGDWLRNKTSIGLLDLGENKLALTPVVLDPKRSAEDRNHGICGIHHHHTHALQSKKVLTMNRLVNDAYDALLTANVVFLNLIDCSAVNTVIECIVRNTPIVVNRHPALEEVLLPSYPGFYESLEHASAILNSVSIVDKCHVHLAKLDKTRFKLSTFVRSFIDILQA